MLHTPNYIGGSVICLITILKGIVFIKKNLFNKNVAGIIG
jgi:hypothetical protein